MKLKKGTPQKNIVFYCATTPTVMVYKMARLFKKNNYETLLFTICNKDQFEYDFYKEAFDEIICSDFQFTKSNIKIKYFLKKGLGLIKFLIFMKKIKPYVVIGIAGNNWQLRLAHKYFFRKYPFIYFPYDILSHFSSSKREALEKGTREFELNAEKYCFENSEGFIHKGDPDEIQCIEGRIHKNINLPKIQLSFLPYCSEEFNISLNKNKLSREDKEFHLVYVGGFPNLKNKELVKKFSTIIKELSEQKIHFHTYTILSHVPREKENEYLKEFFSSIKSKDYFHLHKPLGAKELISEISKYDFGFIHTVDRGEDDLDPVFTTGNKMASYFEAGLPFIHEDSLIFIRKFMESYNLAIPFNMKDIKDFGKRLKKLDYKKFEKNVLKARKDFNMGKNFSRLKSFLEQVIKNKKSENRL